MQQGPDTAVPMPGIHKTSSTNLMQMNLRFELIRPIPLLVRPIPMLIKPNQKGAASYTAKKTARLLNRKDRGPEREADGDSVPRLLLNTLV